jgi:hypothetical protein
MPQATFEPRKTFADLDGLGEELEVTCQRCGLVRCLSGNSRGRDGRTLEGQTIVGRRFTCECGGIGLPTIKRRWPRSLAAHAKAMRT